MLNSYCVSAEPPESPILSRPILRAERPWADDLTANEFRRALFGVPWFARLGQSTPWDSEVVRLNGWEDWPGPGHEGSMVMVDQQQSFYDALSDNDADQRTRTAFDEVRADVVQLSRASVPFDQQADAWHGPTTAVWSAAWTAGLLFCFLDRRLPVPEDLQEQWRWFEAGHWVAGYEGTPGVHPMRLVVL